MRRSPILLTIELCMLIVTGCGKDKSLSENPSPPTALPASGARGAGFGIGSKDTETAKSVVGAWKDAEDMIEMEFRLGKWDEQAQDDPEGDGVAFLCVWAGKPDREGKRPVRSAGFVVWKKAGNAITFEGAVGKGTAVLLDGGKEVSLSWESDELGPYYSRRTQKHQALLKRQ